VRDDPKAKGSVHAPVALGPLALLRASELLHLLRRALSKHLGREREYGQLTSVCGLAPALLVYLRVRVLADGLVPSVHEIGKLPQVLLYEGRVRPQFVETLLTVSQGGQLAFRLGPPLVQLAQLRPQLLQSLIHPSAWKGPYSIS
jgi:hypothetical protein